MRLVPGVQNSCIEIYDILGQKVVYKYSQTGGEWGRFVWNEYGLSSIGCYTPRVQDPFCKEIKSIIINPFLKELYILDPIKSKIKFRIKKDSYYLISNEYPFDTIKTAYADILEKVSLK